MIKLSALFFLATAACHGDCTEPEADVSSERALRMSAMEIGGSGESIDLVVGTGRRVQNDRRASVDLSFRLPDGKVLGALSTTLEYPVWFIGADQMRRTSASNDKLFAGLIGMREGGTREFTFKESAAYVDFCLPRQGMCHLDFGAHDIAYPAGVEITVRAQLHHLCAPSYCVETIYSIPVMTSHRKVERWCR